MSYLPATPDNPNEDAAKYASKIAVPSIDKQSSAFKATQTSLHEPSPASTCGNIATGDSVPATPQDPTATLINSLRAVQMDDSIERISGSPVSMRQDKHYAQSERRADVTRGSVFEIFSSPSKSGSIGKLHNQASANSSPTTERYKNIVESPSWRREEKFVRQTQQADDPFVSGANAGRKSNPGAAFHPREDRAGLQLSGDTAQAVLPPNACVFVANLSQTRSDDQLEYSVVSVFSAFGIVYVKIRRDNKGMPFAFCQYENVSDAQRAITVGRGLLVDGRPCRTEVAKVNRSLYLSKVTGGPISENEARNVLARYGALEKVWYCSQTDKEMFRLPDGVWVMFAFFQDCRDAQAGFRDDPTYRLEQPRVPEDTRTRLGGRHHQSPMSPMARSTPGNINHNFVSPQTAMRRATDLCSIFVGNLPPNTEEEHLRELFGAYGRISHVEIVRKPSVNANGVNAFAFIEFFTQEEAAQIPTKGTFVIAGARLRIERKESVDPFTRRDSFRSGGSPNPRLFAESQEAMAMLFQRGVSIGMANAAASQAQAMPPPVYAPYSYYQPYSQPQYGPYVAPNAPNENETSTGLQVHGNTYMPQAMGGQFQYPQGPPQYVHYQQCQQRSDYYQWPPGNPNSEIATTPADLATEEAH